jgi:hypothetical protein
LLIIEGHQGIYRELLAEFGYRMEPKAAGSPNPVGQASWPVAPDRA